MALDGRGDVRGHRLAEEQTLRLASQGTPPPPQARSRCRWTRLIGFRSRITVMGQWIWTYATQTGSSSLITEYHSPPRRRTEDGLSTTSSDRRGPHSRTFVVHAGTLTLAAESAPQPATAPSPILTNNVRVFDRVSGAARQEIVLVGHRRPASHRPAGRSSQCSKPPAEWIVKSVAKESPAEEVGLRGATMVVKIAGQDVSLVGRSLFAKF